MKKIFIFILFCCCISFTNAQENNETKIDKNSIFYLVQNYIELNFVLESFNGSDNNTSDYQDNIREIEKQKQDILTQIPLRMISQKVDEKEVEAFLNTKNNLEKKVEYAQAKKQYFEYIDSRVKLINLVASEHFYFCIFELEKIFIQGAQSSKIRSIVDNAIELLKEDIKFNFLLEKEKINDIEKIKVLEEKEENLKTTIKSYNEILLYLRNNAKLLETNFLFNELGLQNAINYINHKTSIEKVNVGKIVISILVVVFFYSLKFYLAKILSFILMKLFRQNLANVELKTHFLAKLQNPIGWFLLIYAIGICFTIVYYPAPVDIRISNALYIVYAILSAWIVISIFDSYGMVVISKLAEKSGKREVVNLIIKILYFIIIVIATLFVLAHLGFNISALIASLGIGGLAVALAAKDIIANFFASVLLLFDNSFNQGDWVEISGVEGTIVEIGLRKTTIRTFDNSLVFLPNSTIMGANIKNWSKRKIGRHVKIYVGVTYDAKPHQLEQLVDDIRYLLATSPLIAQVDDSALKLGGSRAKYRENLVSVNDLEGYKNNTYVAVSGFGASSIDIEVYFYTKAVDAAGFREARQRILLEIMKIVDKNELSFAFPSQSLYIEKINTEQKEELLT
ncbi:mechanosensitive ion channel family protein [Campylobacter insulaenigrae]|uniref:Mechanosensitive ion channel family protein n=1 Tax=Campylobacter insulaenigrae NCTC 12927 TaxID=1031564 RepID=A0A0A8H2S5_9BACT|nr:mechanosensitive ion channel family protein [Campylobacter insulaenigrae]AJC88386.1 mechanosensitive ion channel family protein [Campylobacter insulaenigrae NCTC 12927]MCR6591502.1 mechanosensitive ion channel family protein [Campylobacter insulaenigrae]MCR6593037.1 mechanosensitive ion channel family protein [Campylobacter insulaenigrae]VEH96003.1 mechanosensitive ion channel family protein [Campylobacter insulaenigrae]VEJ52288.1 mechanosensitive ion channel family protein [Campylobacter i